MKTKSEIEAGLVQYTGTEKYYKNFTGILYTDGIKYLCENAECYWLIDTVGSYLPQTARVPFILWRLSVGDNKAILTAHEDKGKEAIVSQEIEYTDFPLDSIEFYQIDGLLLLKTEY